LGIVTKSAMIVRDIDVLREISGRNSISVSLTVTTADCDLARILEPRAPRPDLRLDALRKVREAGIRGGVICAPVLPRITDDRAQLEAVVKAAAEAKANYVHANPLFLKPCSAAVFLPFLKEHFPELVPDYQQRFRGRAFLAPAYRKRISELVRELRKTYGIDEESRFDGSQATAAEIAQMNLFG